MTLKELEAELAGFGVTSLRVFTAAGVTFAICHRGVGSSSTGLADAIADMVAIVKERRERAVSFDDGQPAVTEH